MAASPEKEELTHKIQSLLLRKTGNTSRDSMQALFNSYDHDRNGRIGGNELKDLLNDRAVFTFLAAGLAVDGLVVDLLFDFDAQLAAGAGVTRAD